ncbi:polysaccharide biosynthesis protein [Cohnella faecalis]|uniref:Polysaccharide biosynthesis protein n=1 Tax=Cohnella faecalis TaxID=2315694 RepID=A0A398CZD8_9BACL|nr:nucleoside-diphosphate sugar epimerase/dehydratase [Cohnella faecalis]RIE04294.1 polysaccharide biosynthesis protein [Cohnella faecalis]
MSLRKKMLLLFIIDMAVIWFSIWSSYALRFSGNIPESFLSQMSVYGLVSSLLCGLSMIYFGMYRKLWQYASVGDLILICKSVVVGSLASIVVTTICYGQKLPLPVVLRNVETMLLLIGGSRFAWRMLRTRVIKTDGTRIRTLIYGAGECGAMIAKELLNPNLRDRELVGFMDDDDTKHRMHIFGVAVLGNRSRLSDIVSEYRIKEIIIAIPSAPRSEITEIISRCVTTGVKVKLIPAMDHVIKGNITFNTVREVEVEDLLGRESVATDLEGIANYVHNKVVLVTGAGGSIGSELCRQIIGFEPDKLLLLGHGENSIYTIGMELRNIFPESQTISIIADIQDRSRMEEVFKEFHPHVVFHAAAHKHVPLMESNPTEAIKNNVFGTKNVADLAAKYGAERFVLISSDKAVNPSSVMGTTKRIAEMYIQSLSTHSKTKFAAVRFGNVLGSRGSVIPLFKEQIARGGPVTVTHPEMVRFFMTIPEAVQLVIQAGAFSDGGEIFVLDMGKPVRIVTLAEDLIRLSGFEPYKDIPIEFSGVRDGEKLFEELLFVEEEVAATQHDRIFIGMLNEINRFELEKEFKRLEQLIHEEKKSIKVFLDQMVPSAHRKSNRDLVRIP